jgi:phosphomannomutase
VSDATAWRDQDPDPETRAELDALIANGDLGDRFDGRLEFGTAGLRGELGVGPMRMNRVLVAQAAGGLAQYLLSTGTDRSIVIGYDGRKNSRVFAEDTAEIMAGAGIRTTLLPRLLPTPVLAFAVRHLDTSAGVMVTASHNPAADNGYKVYLGGLDHGSQIVPPADAAIAGFIDTVASGTIADLPRSSDYELAPESVIDAYVDATAALGDPTLDPPTFVYTAMHGVGWETAAKVFEKAGLGTPELVTEQIEPDATFPTVAFPNPEEPGALDLAIAKAVAVGAELVVANDPDADRLAIAVPHEGSYRRLSGNEVGLLLGWAVADTGVDGTLAASIVSSPGLEAIARKYGLDYVDTLTGFKWISRAGGLVYGFEEALGYLVNPETIRDKDGISAAVVFLRLVAELKAKGKTLDDHQRDFDEKFGAFASSQISIRVSDLAEIPRLMTRVRGELPSDIGGVTVQSVDDFRDGFGGFGPSDILRFWLDGKGRVIVRPSGTEPKLKVYIDASSTNGSVDERRAEVAATVAALDAGMRKLLA